MKKYKKKLAFFLVCIYIFFHVNTQCGKVAQLVRALGSYPSCREFKSPPCYQMFQGALLSLRSFAGLMFYTLFVYNVAFIIHIVLKKIVLSF